MNAWEAARYTLTKNATTQNWEVNIPVTTIKNTHGITGTVYYG